MEKERIVAAPPDDGGHTGSTSTPNQELAIESTPRRSIRDRGTPFPLILGITLLLAVLFFLIFLPRF